MGDSSLEPLSSIGDESLPRRDRLAASRQRSGVRSRFSQELERWLAINHWTPSLFAALTDHCLDRSLSLSAREIGAILSGSRLELMPRHFRVFAAVEGLTRAERPAQPLSDQDLIACFATSICRDEASLQPSWWFALYCGEEWALQKLREPFSGPLHELTSLRRVLPPLLRNAIAAKGMDPVAALRDSAQRLPRSSALKPQRFLDWILEYDRLDERELRLAIAFAMLLMAELGLNYTSILDVPLPAGDAVSDGGPRRLPAPLRG